MNPRPRSRRGHATLEYRCTPDQVARYQGRLSGPFMDRLDLVVEVRMLAPQTLAAAPAGERSAVVAAPARWPRRARAAAMRAWKASR